MSGDSFTTARMTWLDQVMLDSAIYKTLATTVAYVIAKYFNRQRFIETGALNAWPSYATLADTIGCSERSIQRAVQLLRDHGHIETTYHGGGHSSLEYCALLIPDRVVTGDHSKGFDDHARVDTAVYPEGRNAPPRVDTAVYPSDTAVHPRVDTAVYQNLRNKSLNEIFEEGAGAKDGAKPRPSGKADGQIGLGKKGNGRQASAHRSKPGASGKPAMGVSHGKAARAGAERRLDAVLKGLSEPTMAHVAEWFTAARYDAAVDAEMHRRGGGMDYVREAMGEDKLAAAAADDAEALRQELAKERQAREGLERELSESREMGRDPKHAAAVRERQARAIRNLQGDPEPEPEDSGPIVDIDRDGYRFAD